jgi:hypothetical protein
VHFTAVLSCLADELGLAGIFPVSFAQRIFEPGVEAARVDAQAATHRTHRERGAMLGNKRVSHLAFLAKYVDRDGGDDDCALREKGSKKLTIQSPRLNHRRQAP